MESEALAPWRSPLARALHRNRALAHSRYLQLATLDAEQRPANRTVVFRGFLAQTNKLQFITDARSQKVQQLAINPWAEACWYLPKTREQFHLLGQLQVVDNETTDAHFHQAYRTVWQSLSDQARLQFTWLAPGVPYTSEITAPDAPEPLVNPLEPLSTFRLLLLDPIRVDHLELQGTPHHRCLYCQKDSTHWSMERLNP